jgi:hypothetical protein
MPVVHYMPIVGGHTIRLEALSADRLVRLEACQQIAKLAMPDLELSVNVFRGPLQQWLRRRDR